MRNNVLQIKAKFSAIFLIFMLNDFANLAISSEKNTSIQKATLEIDIIDELLPIKQKQFLKNLKEFALQYLTSPNAIQQFLLREKRKIFINENFKDRIFSEWVGRIKKIQTTENGEASLEIELAALIQKNPANMSLENEFNITLGTFNKVHNDLEYKTLIKPGSPLYNWLANFKEGEWIVFSGNSFLGDKDYLKIATTNEYGAMIRPKFIVKFEFFEKINLNGVNLKTNEGKTLSKTTKRKNNIGFNNVNNSKTITIRYYQNYRLSNYNWNYNSFINRWHKLVRYHWDNHPPLDYLIGDHPNGGEVFVLVTVKKDGSISNFEVNSLGQVSKIMEISALEAVRAVLLPSLPEDYPNEELKVEFRFAHSRISHLLKNKINTNDTIMKQGDNKSNSSKNEFSKMNKKILLKQLQSAARESYNEVIKHELSSHFSPIHSFEPNLELLIELAIDKNGQVIEKKLTNPVKSEKFLLAVMNSLSKARFDSLPKSLASNTPYRVRIKIIP